jgi:hypothetical protein
MSRGTSSPPTRFFQINSWLLWFTLPIILVNLLLFALFNSVLFQLLSIALLIGSISFIFLFLRPTWALYILVFSLFSLHWLTDSLQILPKLFNFSPDILIIIAFLKGMCDRLRLFGTLPRTIVDRFVVLFICLAILSHILNSSDSIIVFFNGVFRQNLKFILLFYAIVYLAPSDRVLRRLIFLFIGLELLQIPITIIQALHYTDWDFVGGTLGAASTGILALSALMVMALLFGFSQAYRKAGFAIVALMLFIPAIVGEGKITFVLGPLMILFLLTYRLAFLRVRAIFSLILFFLVYGLSLVALNALLPQARSLNVLSSLSYTLQNYERPLANTGGIPRSRIGDLQFTFELLSVDASKILFGYGPGSSSRAFAEVANGSLYRRFQEHDGLYFYFSFVQLSTTSLEYGLVGLTIFLLVLWKLYRYTKRFLSSVTDQYWWAIAWGFRGVMLVYVAGIVYWRVWSTEILASIFWLLAGCIVVQNGRVVAPHLTSSPEPEQQAPI